MWFYGIMVHKKVNSDRASKRHFESTSFFSFGDKSRLFITEDCNSKNTLLTPGVINTTTERNLTTMMQLFSSRLLVSLHSSMHSAPYIVICIFLSCGFHGVVLHIKGFCF